jgi:pimeloyl-ACP methyl ester carboxylesterase
VGERPAQKLPSWTRSGARTRIINGLSTFYRGAGNPGKPAALSRPESERIQPDLFCDYRTSVTQYPVWQQYLRTWKPPTLVVWGKNDPIFTPEGAEAFRRDVPETEIHLLDTGHFALEEDVDRIVAQMKGFFARRVRSGTVRGARTPVPV